MATRERTLKTFFFAALAVISFAGALANGRALLQDFYIRPLARFAGYLALFAYSLLILGRARYNTRHNHKGDSQ